MALPALLLSLGYLYALSYTSWRDSNIAGLIVVEQGLYSSQTWETQGDYQGQTDYSGLEFVVQNT